MRLRFTIFVTLALIAGLIACYAEPALAKEQAAADRPNLRISVSVPDDIIFDNNVVVSIKDNKSGRTEEYIIEETDDFISQLRLAPGTYNVETAYVTEEYEGEFECSFSSKPFKLVKDMDKPYEAVISLKFLEPGETAEEPDSEGENRGSAADGESGTIEHYDEGSGEWTDESDSEIGGDDMTDADTNKDAESEAFLLSELSRHRGSILVSLGVTAAVLAGLGITYVVLKKRRDEL